MPASLIRRGPLALFLDLDGVLAPIESRPEDVGPDPRHRFRQKTAPATDVEDAQTGERFVVGQVAPELRRDL